MRITFKGDYALKAILDLSFTFGNPQTIDSIAKRQDIPVKFLEQILLTLKKGGFVVSSRGRIGGYALSRPPQKITLGEIISYIDGPVEPISCTLKKGGTKCSYSAKCAFYDIFCEIGDYISSVVNMITFEDLKERQLRKETNKGKYLDYNI